MAKTLLEEIDAHTRLYMDRKTGIAWVEDARAGVGHSVHPNISGTGSSAGMRRRGFWKKDDRIVRSHGFLYNIDVCQASDELDQIAGRACRCGGNHACVSANRAGRSDNIYEEKVTRQDFRPRTSKGYYKRGIDVIRVDQVEPYRSAPGKRLNITDWWVYATGTYAPVDRDGPSPGTPSATVQMQLHEFTSSNWKRVDVAKLSPKWRSFFARNK